MKYQIRKIISVALIFVICFSMLSLFSSAATVINSNTIKADTLEVWEWTLVTNTGDLSSYPTGKEIMNEHNPSSLGDTSLSDYYKEYLADYKLLVIYGFSDSDFENSVVPSGYWTDGGSLMDTSSCFLCFMNAAVSDSGTVLFYGDNVDSTLGKIDLGSTTFKTEGCDFSGLPYVVFAGSNKVYLWNESESGNAVEVCVFNSYTYAPESLVISPYKYNSTNRLWSFNRVNLNLYGGYFSFSYDNTTTYLDCPQSPYAAYSSIDCYFRTDTPHYGRCMFYIGKKVNEIPGYIKGDYIIPSGNTVTISETSTIYANSSIIVEPGAKLMIEDSVQLDGTIRNYGTVVVADDGKLQITENGSFENIGKSSQKCNDGKTRDNEGNLIISRNGNVTIKSDYGSSSTKLWSYSGKISCAGTIKDMNYLTSSIYANLTYVYFPYGADFSAPNRVSKIKDYTEFYKQFSFSYIYDLLNENYSVDR